MKKTLFVSALLVILCYGAAVQRVASQSIGKSFPAMQVETMDDKVMNLPEDTKGRVTLIGMAYSKKSEEDLNTWMAPVFQTFIQQKIKDGGLFASFAHDIDVYFIPMFTGIHAAAKGIAKKNAAKHLDSRLLPYVLFYQGSLKPYKEALDFEKRDVPYFFLLDQNGNIVYATSGTYTDQKMEAIEEAIDGL